MVFFFLALIFFEIESLHIFGVLLRTFGTEKRWLTVSNCLKNAPINQSVLT